MTPEEMSLLIPQYLSGQMTPAEKDAFEAELGTNAGLRLEVDELRPVWEGLGSLPQEAPSPALRARFYQKLHDIQTGRHVVSASTRGGSRGFRVLCRRLLSLWLCSSWARMLGARTWTGAARRPRR